MPLYNPPLGAVNKEETRRYAGLRGATAFPEALLDKACAEALLFARPRAVWQFYAYDAHTATIAGPAPLRLTGSVARHLAGAAEVAET